MGINLAVSIVIGFLTVLTGQIGEGDIKLIVGIAACLQPMLNVMFVLLYFVTLLIAAILRRLSIYNFNPQKALLAMGTEMMLDFNYFVEKVATLGLLKGIVATLGKDTGALDIAYADVPSGKGIKRIGGPVIFIALVATIARISWILGVVL